MLVIGQELDIMRMIGRRLVGQLFDVPMLCVVPLHYPPTFSWPQLHL